MSKEQRCSGFTIVELMIVMAIIGILAAIAYPAYTDSVRKSARGDAKAALVDLSQFMMRTYTENRSYTPSGALPTLPFIEVPRESSNKKYRLTLTASTTTYQLTATPINTQVGDSCGALSIDHLGRKGAEGNVSRCW